MPTFFFLFSCKLNLNNCHMLFFFRFKLVFLLFVFLPFVTYIVVNIAEKDFSL